MRTYRAIDSFLLERESKNLSPNTVDWYRRMLRPFLQRYSELPEKPEAVRLFMRGVGGSDHAKHAHYRAVRALYNFVHREWGFPLEEAVKNSEANPIRRVAAPVLRRKVMRTLSLEELHRLVTCPNVARERKT